MTTATVTQVVAQVLTQNSDPNAEVTQVVAQALTQNSNPNAEVTQVVAQALTQNSSPNAEVTQVVAQVLTKLPTPVYAPNTVKRISLDDLPTWQRTGLIAWYPCDQKDSSILYDRSGYNWHLTSTGIPEVLPDPNCPSTVVDRIAYCGLESQTYGWVNSSFPTPADYTMAAWVRSDGSASQNQTAVSMGVSNAETTIIKDGSPEEWGMWDTDNGWARTGFGLTAGDWLLIVVSYNGITGEAKRGTFYSPKLGIWKEITDTSTVAHRSDSLRIGYSSTYSSMQLEGAVADVRVYDYAMNFEEQRRYILDQVVRYKPEGIIHEVEKFARTPDTTDVYGTGTLQSQEAEVSATGRVLRASGVLISQEATLVGTGRVTIYGTGSLSSQNSTLLGSGEVVRTTPISGIGSLASQAAIISGVARVTPILGAGTLSSQDAIIAGSGVVFDGTISGTGTLQAQSAIIEGTDEVTLYHIGIRVDSESLLVLHQNPNPPAARVDKEVLLVLHENNLPVEARVDKEVLLVLHENNIPVEAIVDKEALLVLHQNTGTVEARVDKEALLVLHENNYTAPTGLNVKVSQAPIQVLAKESNAEVRVTQTPLQVLVTEVTYDELHISQVPIQVLVSETKQDELQISQAPIQVLVKGTDDAVNNLRISQAPVQILVKEIPMPGMLCFTVCFEDGTYPTDTFDYVLLLGADVATATFIQADTVYIENGSACITQTEGDIGDDVILVLQLGDLIGAYEGVLQ